LASDLATPSLSHTAGKTLKFKYFKARWKRQLNIAPTIATATINSLGISMQTAYEYGDHVFIYSRTNPGVGPIDPVLCHM
jgi:phosphoglycerol transferase MdoB-like AlkP superfamily enzyme